MKNPFQRRKENGRVTPSPVEKFLIVLDQQKHRLADSLNAKLARLSRRKQRTLLLSLGLIITAVCIGLLVQAYNGGPDVLNAVQPGIIVQPPLRIDRSLDVEDRQHLREFRLMMDTLRESPYGEEIYEQIKRERPGLLDTINMLLKMR